MPPSRVGERLNRQFPMDRTRQYFTLVYGVIDPASGRFQYVMAGHPAPVLLPTAGRRRRWWAAGLPIGMIEDASFEDESLTLQPGDRLYFYTDGVIEALERRRGGIRPRPPRRGNRPLARPPPARRASIVVAAAVRAWCGGLLKDDVSLLAVERIG